MLCRKVYKDNGSVAVIYPAPKSKRSDESESDWLNRVFSKAIQQDLQLIGRDFDDVDDSNLPSRKFRDAWVGSKGNPITIDDIKKKNIINEKLISDEINNRKISERDSVIEDLKSKGKLQF